LDLARRIIPDVRAVFVDTGLEFPELRDFVKSVPNVTWLKPDMNFRKVIEVYGYPVISKLIAKNLHAARSNPDCYCAKNIRGEQKGSIFNSSGKWSYLINAPFQISDYCCTKMKKQPGQKFRRQTGLHPVYGTMACESLSRRAAWLKHGCNAFDGKEPSSQPISFWTEQDILKYIKEYEVPYASVYGKIVEDDNGVLYTTGYKRTGCVFCGFGCQREKEPNRFQMLKLSHPKLWEYCMKPWNEGGLGMREVLNYIGVKTE